MWDKPKKKMSKEEWELISADGAPPGVYTPNMSDDDRKRWKAKKIGGKNPRVEIRKTCVGTNYKGSHAFSQLLLIVLKDGRVQMSANGTSVMEAAELVEAVIEASDALKE
jgi:hypothetical protein